MNDTDDPAGRPEQTPSRALDEALGIVGLLRQSGVTMTEAEPTSAMLAAGMAVSGLDADRVRAVFRAMLAADGDPNVRVQRAPHPRRPGDLDEVRVPTVGADKGYRGQTTISLEACRSGMSLGNGGLTPVARPRHLTVGLKRIDFLH